MLAAAVVARMATIQIKLVALVDLAAVGKAATVYRM
jgi:hypothetical protein